MTSIKRLALVAACGFGLAAAGGTSEVSTNDDTGTDDDTTLVPVDAGADGFGPDGASPDGATGDTDEGDQDTGNPWADSDKDGHLDRFDNCPMIMNPDQKDKDGDGVGNDCDNKPECANKDQKTEPCEGDGRYDYGQDRDGDGVDDVNDNCLETKNKNQTDSDGDGIGDKCETPTSEKVGSGMDSDDDGLSDKKESELGTNSGQVDTDGDGMLDGVEVAIGTDPNTSDKACGDKEYTADLVRKPIDIIFAIDTSGSMGSEISGVQSNINNNFTNIIQNSGVDYRVIMLADKDSVCIDKPLGTGNCGDGASTDNPPRFYHIDQAHDGGYVSERNWKNIIEYYDGTQSGDEGSSGRPYKNLLRKNSFKVLVAVSDEGEQAFNASSDPKGAAQKFDQELRKKSTQHFGTKSDRNYEFHSIVGVPPKGSNNRKAWQPNEPVQDSRCNANGNYARANPEDEHASKMTGGLRYPVCETPSYDAVFKAMAKSVVKRAQIKCSLGMPKTTQSIDNDKVALQWKPDGASQPTVLHKVHDKKNCGSNNFYLENGDVKLCSSICKTVKNTNKGKLQVFVGCESCMKSEEKCDYQDNNCDGQVDEGCKGCVPEVCDGKDNDCDQKIDEACCQKQQQGESCTKDDDCCSGHCKSSGVCGKPCRPTGKSCVNDSQCCSDNCAGTQSGSLGSCFGT